MNAWWKPKWLARPWVLAAVMLSFSACAATDMKHDQTIDLNNAGKEDVYNFQVTYGELRFPKAPHARFDPGGGGHYSM